MFLDEIRTIYLLKNGPNSGSLAVTEATLKWQDPLIDNYENLNYRQHDLS